MTGGRVKVIQRLFLFASLRGTDRGECAARRIAVEAVVPGGEAGEAQVEGFRVADDNTSELVLGQGRLLWALGCERVEIGLCWAI